MGTTLPLVGAPGAPVPPEALAITPAEVESLLERIGYRGERKPVPETLRELHEAFLLSVPFENLDIVAGRPIRFDVHAFHEKIVGRGRGGFCYEMNGLFAGLLASLGFDVKLLSGRIIAEDGVLGQEFDHLVMLIEMPQRWLADVGFGSSFRWPLRLDDAGEQADFRCWYRLTREGEAITVYQKRLLEGAWYPEYQFTLKPRRLAEFADACLWHQRSADSSLNKLRLCTQATRTGRVTIMGNRLIVLHKGKKTVRDFKEAEFDGLLKRYFGMVVSA